MKEAKLVLEDGKVFYGKSFGCEQACIGEVVFNTGMTGYQEILTDPSYAGQIVVMTYPLIGSYGVNLEDVESSTVKVKGLVVKEYCELAGNWKHSDTLGNYLQKNGVPGICGIDTRALTRYLRSKGTMKGIIATGHADEDLLAEKAFEMDDAACSSPMEAGTKKPYVISGLGPKITVLDFGIKNNILRYLVDMNCEVTVLPGSSSLGDIAATNYDGLLLSNGPGDPGTLVDTVGIVKKLLNHKPIFGICLGHQILGMALGGHTYKLLFGHRGANHPVKDLVNGRVYITSQNHGYALDCNSLDPENIHITHVNLNDGTVEGISHKELPVFSVQYHPEAAPGPQDSKYLFLKFMDQIKAAKAV